MFIQELRQLRSGRYLLSPLKFFLQKNDSQTLHMNVIHVNR